MKRMIKGTLLLIAAALAIVIAGCGEQKDANGNSVNSTSPSNASKAGAAQDSGLTIAMVTHSDEGSFWSVGQEGRRAGGQGRGRQADLEPVQQRPAEAGAADRRRGLAEGRRPRRSPCPTRTPSRARWRRPRRPASRSSRSTPAPTTTRSSARSPTSARPRGSPARRPARKLKDGGRQEGPLRHPRAEQHRPAAALRGRQGGLRRRRSPTCRSRAPSDIATTQTEIKSKLQADKSFDAVIDAQPGHRRRREDRDQGRELGAPSSPRSTSARTSSRTSRPARPVRGRPAAVPAGLPADRVPEAVQDERQHRRRRPAGADRSRASSTRPTRRRSRSSPASGTRVSRKPIAPARAAPPQPAPAAKPVARRAAGQHQPDAPRSCAARRSARCWRRSSWRSSSGPRTRCSSSSTGSRTGPTSPRRSASRRWSSRC